jgi:hypothetical protein
MITVGEVVLNHQLLLWLNLEVRPLTDSIIHLPNQQTNQLNDLNKSIINCSYSLMVVLIIVSIATAAPAGRGWVPNPLPSFNTSATPPTVCYLSTSPFIQYCSYLIIVLDWLVCW